MAKVLDIQKYLERPIKNRVTTVGMEIEGGWVSPIHDESAHHDASVDRAKKWDRGSLYFVGEYTSKPMSPIGIDAWVHKVFPAKFDASCGLHIHMGFRNLRHYSLLMDTEDYQETMLEAIREWGEENKIPKRHHLYSRLKGENKYCAKMFWPDLQSQCQRKVYMNQWEQQGLPAPEGHRYTQINFCYGTNKTLEWRVLPVFDTPELCVSSLQLVVNVTNACLAVLSKVREETVEVSLSLGSKGNGYHEVIEEIVRYF